MSIKERERERESGRMRESEIKREGERERKIKQNILKRKPHIARKKDKEMERELVKK